MGVAKIRPPPTFNGTVEHNATLYSGEPDVVTLIRSPTVLRVPRENDTLLLLPRSDGLKSAILAKCAGGVVYFFVSPCLAARGLT